MKITFEETNPAVCLLNYLYFFNAISRNDSVFYNSVCTCRNVRAPLLTTTSVSNSSCTIVRMGESRRRGIRGVSWIHCDAFHVELFVLPGGVQFGESEDTTAGNPDTSATVSATRRTPFTTGGCASWRLYSRATPAPHDILGQFKLLQYTISFKYTLRLFSTNSCNIFTSRHHSPDGISICFYIFA